MAAINPVVCFRRQWSALFLAASVLLAGAQGPPRDFEIKAVYLVKFIQFVEWPSSAFAADDTPFVIGVLGSDPFGEALDEVAKGETVKNHHVIVRRFRNIREISNVQVLYVSSSESSHMPAILSALKDRNILSASDLENFSTDGGIVRFVTENKKVRFRINIDAARRANLQISSKLLQLAEVVHDARK